MSQVQQITHFPLHRKARLQNDTREGEGGGGGEPTDSLVLSVTVSLQFRLRIGES